MKKSTKRRDKSKYPGLDKKYNLKIRQDLLDYDYLDQLTPEQKDWLNRFTEEWVSANFDHSGERVHPKQYKTKKVKATGKRRKVDIYKKECEDMNNARNRCALSVTKSNNMLKGQKDVHQVLETDRSTNNYDVENALVEMIDASLEKV